MKCNKCKYGYKTKWGWKCKISPYCIKDEDRNKYKCQNCVWSAWTGINYFCMLPRCKKED